MLRGQLKLLFAGKLVGPRSALVDPCAERGDLRRRQAFTLTLGRHHDAIRVIAGDVPDQRAGLTVSLHNRRLTQVGRAERDLAHIQAIVAFLQLVAVTCGAMSGKNRRNLRPKSIGCGSAELSVESDDVVSAAASSPGSAARNQPECRSTRVKEEQQSAVRQSAQQGRSRCMRGNLAYSRSGGKIRGRQARGQKTRRNRLSASL